LFRTSDLLNKSNEIHHHVISSKNNDKAIERGGFNKTIYILWFQGFHQAPEVVHWCVQSWKYYNPTWTLVLLDHSNIHQYISSSEMKKKMPNKANMIPSHVSDVIRLLLLGKYGGVWADSTVFCNRPLDDWLYGQNISAGFFAFSRPGPDRMLSSWFLYSAKQDYLVDQWANATIHYFATHKQAEHYFILHYLFQDLYDHDIQFQSIWKQVPQIPVPGGPHLFLERGYTSPLTKDVIQAVNSKAIPVYKLSWKNVSVGGIQKLHNNRKEHEMTNIEYLFSTIKRRP
jgi:hypothetical protein